MTDVDKSVIARLKVGSSNFEILVDCEKAIKCKEGNCNLSDVLVTKEIFKDVKTGERSPEAEMKASFKTTEVMEIAKRIISKGQIQLTTEYKAKLREEKNKQIINIICRNAIDSRTGLPHPPARIERAMEEAKVRIDEFKSAEGQVQDVLAKLRPLIPLRFETREIAVRIPSSCAAKSYLTLKNYGKLSRVEWQNDGSLVAVVEIPAGIQEEFFNELNKLSRGEVETKILSKK